MSRLSGKRANRELSVTSESLASGPYLIGANEIETLLQSSGVEFYE
jgi:hypothetical protein